MAEWLDATNYALRSTDEDSPALTSDEGAYWLNTLNRKISELFTNSRVLFDSTWEVKDLGTVTASATPTYPVQDDSLTPVPYPLIAPSDKVLIVTLDGNKRYYDLVKPRERSDNTRYFYLSGVNPQVLHCTNEITADEDIVGGTLYLPGYYLPAELTSETDDIPVPDPYWAVMSVAAELAFNDLTYEDKSEGLNTKANNLYMQMVRTNRRGTHGEPRTTPYKNYRIRSTEVS